MEPYRRFFMLQKLLVCDGLFGDGGEFRKVPTRDMFEEVLRHVRLRNPGGLFIITGVLKECKIVDFNKMSWSTRYLGSPVDIDDFQIVSMNDGSILTVGGTRVGKIGSATRKCFWLTCKGFTMVGRMESARVGHALVALHDGRALAFGGYGRRMKEERTVLASMEYFSLASQKWTTSAVTLPRAASNLAAVVLTDGTVFIMEEGTDEYEEAPMCYIFDPTLETFMPRKGMTKRRLAFGAALMPDGCVLVCGGRSGKERQNPYYPFEIYKHCELYNPVTDTWGVFPDMEMGVFNHSCAVMSSFIVVMGRETERMYQRFDFGTWKWESRLHGISNLGECVICPFMDYDI